MVLRRLANAAMSFYYVLNIIVQAFTTRGFFITKYKKSLPKNTKAFFYDPLVIIARLFFNMYAFFATYLSMIPW